MKKVIYLIALLAPLLLIHCKKDTVSEESRLDLLTGRKWKSTMTNFGPGCSAISKKLSDRSF